MQHSEFLTPFRRFNRFYANLLARFAGTFYNEALTMTEANVLTEIQQNPHITAQQISQTLSLNKGQLSVVLKKLEHAGLIQKLPSKQDKRAFELVLTEQGKAAFMAQLEQTDTMLLQELQAFSEAQIGLLAEAANQFERLYTQNNDVEIVAGDWRDVGFIADLHCRVYAQMGWRADLQPYVLDALSEFVRNGCQGKIWIAKVNGQRVGTVSLVQKDADEWQLRWFVLDSRYQGLGLGKKLMAALMDFVHSQGIKRVVLSTVQELAAARALYAQFGFRPVRETPNAQWKAEPIIEEYWLWEQ